MKTALHPSTSRLQRFLQRYLLLGLLFAFIAPSASHAGVPAALDLVDVATGTSLSNGSSLNLGTVARLQSTAPRSLRITNNGASSLDIQSIALASVTPEFTLGSVALPATLAPTESLVFTVTARPGVTGNRSMLLRITSNDGGIPASVYAVTLNVTGLLPNQLGFEAEEVTVGQTATSVNLVIRRKAATRGETVRVTTTDGPGVANPFHAPAIGGVDYLPFNQVVTFSAGQSMRTVNISLVPMTGSVDNRQFTVSLSEPTGGASITRATMLVRIRATDTTAPVVNVTAPAAGTTEIDAALEPTLAIQGTATDAKGVTRMTLELNGRPAVNIPFTFVDQSIPPTSVLDSRSIAFNFPIVARLGANKAVIKAHDGRGNVATIVREFDYTGGVALNVQRVIPAGVTRFNTVGQVTLSANPMSHARPLASTGVASTQSTMAVPGAMITVNASPFPGYALSHFSNLPAGAAIVGSTASFVMPSNPITIEAHFVAQPFSPPTGYGNTFAGLVRFNTSHINNVGKSASVTSSGFFQATLANTGALSGTIEMGQSKVSFTGRVFGDGRVTLGTSATNQAPTLTLGSHVITLTYDTTGRNTLSCVAVHQPTTTHSSGVAFRSYYSAARKVAPGLRGYHTLALAPRNLIPTPPIQGFGFATLTLSETGTAVVRGELADGSTFSVKSVLTDTGSGTLTLPIFGTSLPGGAPANAPKQCFGLNLVFNRHGPSPNMDPLVYEIMVPLAPEGSGWFRPAVAGASLYPAGWPQGIEFIAVGYRYNRSSSFQVHLGSPTPKPSGNMMIQFNYGKISSVVGASFNVIGNAVSVVNPISGFSVRLDPNTGILTGTFTPDWSNPSATLPTFRGILVSGLGQGSGYFRSNVAGDTAPEVGAMSMIGIP